MQVDERRKLRLTFLSLRFPEVQDDDVLREKCAEGNSCTADGREVEIGGSCTRSETFLSVDLGYNCQPAKEEEKQYSLVSNDFHRRTCSNEMKTGASRKDVILADQCQLDLAGRT